MTDLETVLEAWHSATLRLEKTHEALREEVQHLAHGVDAFHRAAFVVGTGQHFG